MQNPRTLAVITLLMIAGFALRLYHIDSVSFRGDEAFTILNWVRQPFPEVLQTSIPTSDPQPPLAYALFHYWGQVFGDSEFSMRLLPALTNLAGIAVIYALGKQILGYRVGLLAALLWALHPFEIWHSQDARNYAVWATLSVMALWLALRALQHNRRPDWLLYIIAAALAAYVYYLELFMVAALNLYAAYLIFLRRPARRGLLIPWATSQIAIGLILAPWFLQERLLTGSGYGGTTGRFDLSLLASQFLSTLTFGSTLPDNLLAVLSLFVLVLIIAGGVMVWRRQRDTAIVLLLIIITPTLLLALVSMRLNVFTPRYILGIVPALLLLIATLVIDLWQQHRPGSGLAAGVILTALLTINAFSLGNHYMSIDYTKSPPWREVVAYLHSRVEPDDVVINASSDIAFKLYYDDTTAIRYLPANPIQPSAEIKQVLAESQQIFSSLWAIGQPTADWQNAPVRDTWLDENMQLVRSARIDTIPIRQYLPFAVAQSELPNEDILETFDNVAHLRHAILSQPSEPQTGLHIRAYWQPLTTTATPLKIFVHMVGPVNPATGSTLWAQADHFPQDGRTSTTAWSPGEIYRDVYVLAVEGIPAGEYTVLVGLYDPESGQRVLTTSGEDHYLMGSIRLP